MEYAPGLSPWDSGNGSKPFVTDRLGSVTKITDWQGNSPASKSFDAFGVQQSGGTSDLFGFAGAWGYQSDADHGLQLLGHRVYDADLGRFLTRDPIKDGRNWYGYCENNPTGAVDDEGLDERKITGFTKHGLNQIIGRDGGAGVSNQGILDAIKHGEIKPGRNGTTHFRGKLATVVLNSDGKVVTGWANQRGGIRGVVGSATAVISFMFAADVLIKGIDQVVHHRRRIQKHLDGDDSVYIEYEGIGS